MRVDRTFPLLLLALGALASVPLAQVGSVLHARRVNEILGGFGGQLDPGDGFGESLAALGDLDGDGVTDLAVSAPDDDDGGSDRGAVWIVFLNADGSVKNQAKISQTQGGFTGTLGDDSYFGASLANVGDLDGDGNPELAVVSRRPYELWVLFLNPDGTVRTLRENLYPDPAFVPPVVPNDFGDRGRPGGLCALGDLDGDGLGDIALGAPRDSELGEDAGALWIVYLAADGSPKSALKINTGRDGFTGVLAAGDKFGGGVEQLGDLDGDGNRELAVWSGGADFLGQVWTLFLDANEQVKSHTVHGVDDYGLPWPSGVTFGTSGMYRWLDDLDGDGKDELAIGFAGHNFPGGHDSEGGIVVATLQADGGVAKRVRISHQRGGLGDLPGSSDFGRSLADLGDLDGDGNPELAVGAPGDPTPGVVRKGGFWILSLAPSAVRNGSGVNPLILSQASAPVFGTTWTATLDCSGHGPGMAFVFGYGEASSGLVLPAGEVLVGGTPKFFLQAVHTSGPTLLSGNIPPYSLALIDLPVHIQGLCTGVPAFQLSNALDIVLGR